MQASWSHGKARHQPLAAQRRLPALQIVADQ
jgi:hypothetical protein